MTIVNHLLNDTDTYGESIHLPSTDGANFRRKSKAIERFVEPLVAPKLFLVRDDISK